jgi:hypothetical protein
MRCKLLFGVFLLTVLVCPAQLSACLDCAIVGAIYGDEYELYWVCRPTQFPRPGYSYCEADSFSIEYGGNCYIGGETCRWVSVPGASDLDHFAALAVESSSPVPGP